jgi:hypothetical protein
MRTSRIRALLLLATLALLTTSVVAQGPETASPASSKSECKGCVSKVFQMSDSSKPYELQDVLNLFRTVVELRLLHADVSQHTITITGTPEQVAISEKLINVLESLRSGGNTPTSVLVYEPQVSQSRDSSTQEASPSKADSELKGSSIKALYRPNSSMQQLQAEVNTLRTTAQILRIQMLPSSHVIVVRGSSEQVTQADSLMNN